MNRQSHAGATALLALLLPACSDSGPLEPPDLRLGQDVCSVCGMAVSDGRYAAAVVLRHAGRDRVLLLDDLGELPQLELPQHDQMVVFVRDEDSQQWLDADHAWFIRAERLRTPMGHGVAALATQERAVARATELEGQSIPLDSLLPTP